MANEEYPPEVKAIVSNVEEWLDSRNNTIDLELTEGVNSSGLVEQNFPGAAIHGPSFLHNTVSEDGHISIMIAFSKKVLPSTTVEKLQETLKFVTLDKLPMPGFKCPPSWIIHPSTPVSSFKEGVEIVSYENGRLHYKVDTRFYCVYGSIPGPYDGGCMPSPRGTYFSVERDIHGLIDVNMPLVFL